ncbi:MAG: hypothetical protein DRO12_05690 [Thermoprotei archaeon]|nr:MAG: hypothetical protein DRO12_05690 [Thermoprotei archaeon]
MEDLIKIIEEQGFKVYNLRNAPLTLLEVYISEHERIVIIKENGKTFVSLDVYTECNREVHEDTLELKEVKLAFSKLRIHDLKLELLFVGDTSSAISVKGLLHKDIRDVAKELKNLVETVLTAVKNFCSQDVSRK